MQISTKSLLCAVAVTVLAAQGIAQGRAEGFPTNAIQVTPEWISRLADEMRATHPAIRAVEARTNAAAAEVAAVRTWEDPTVELGGMLGSTMMRAEDGDIVYGVEQTLPLFGKPGATRRAARAGARVESARLDYRFQQMRAELAKAIFQTALASDTIAIGNEDLAWLQAVLASAEGRYRAGLGTLTEYLRFQNEISIRKADLESDRDRQRQTEVVLNRFLGKPLTNEWPRLLLPQPGPYVRLGPKLFELARKYEPQTEVMRRDIERGNMSVKVAEKKRYPEIKAGVEGRNYSGDGEFRQGMVFLSMSLPWLNSGKYNKDIQREKEMVRALEYDLSDYQRGLDEEIHKLAVKANAALRRAVTYSEEVLPRSRSALESARAGWEAGKSTYYDLLDARRSLLETQLEYATSVAEQYEALAELVLCCGLGDLEALSMLDKIAPN